MSLMCSKTQGIVWSKPTAAGAAVLKKTLALVFSSEICEIFKNTFFTEHLRETTFDWNCWTQDVNRMYIRRSKDVLGVFWTSYIGSIYILYPASFVRNFLELLEQICCKAPVSMSTLTLNIFSIVNPFVFIYTLKVCFLQNFSSYRSTSRMLVNI